MGNMQILQKTYCCNDNKDRNMYNEDLHNNDDTQKGGESDDDKENLVVERIKSFHTDVND